MTATTAARPDTATIDGIVRRAAKHISTHHSAKVRNRVRGMIHTYGDRRKAGQDHNQAKSNVLKAAGVCSATKAAFAEAVDTACKQ